MKLIPISLADRNHCNAVAGIWTGACGAGLALSPFFVYSSLQPQPDSLQAGRLAWIEGEPVGFVIASVPTGSAASGTTKAGCVDAIAALPETQRQGIATRMLSWAESWLKNEGCNKIALGNGCGAFVPGVPLELNCQTFFAHRGYHSGDQLWDVATNLAKYTPPSKHPVAGAARPAQSGQEEAIRTYVRRALCGRWAHTFQRLLERGERTSDLMLLWTERGIDGICRLTFEDSRQSLERYFPYQLPRPWGQLGPLYVSRDIRSNGFGSLLLDGGLRRLHNNGVNGCIVNRTMRLDFYRNFGFKEYRAYQQMQKPLA